jgi:hypothetical protein
MGKVNTVESTDWTDVKVMVRLVAVAAVRAAGISKLVICHALPVSMTKVLRSTTLEIPELTSSDE